MFDSIPIAWRSKVDSKRSTRDKAWLLRAPRGRGVGCIDNVVSTDTVTESRNHMVIALPGRCSQWQQHTHFAVVWYT